jgi:hypothetical protein
MPAQKPTHDEPPSEELLLAAIERAQRHQGIQNRGVILSAIIEHLGLARGSWTTRRLAPKLDALEIGGMAERSRRQGITIWSLTTAGHQWIQTVRATGEIDPLPESPQHRRWRVAHTTADQRAPEFRESLRQRLAEAQQLLNAGASSSIDWFVLSDRLRHECWRMGSATYCLHEWVEPSDAEADIEPPTRNARRDITQWDRP